MLKINIPHFLVLTFSLFTILCFSQELPPILKYSPITYGAGNQNWMISQDKNNFVYFANNDGLLEFNGSNWTLFPSPNETILRSVKVINKKIYTGCYMEFGFWTKQVNGLLKYTSLSSKIKSQILDDEQFWNILNYDQWVVFQSLNRIYIYDTNTEKFNIITPKNSVYKSYSTINSIYFQTHNDGLFEIENGKAKLVSNNPIVLNNKIINVFSIDEGLIIQTEWNGFFKLINGNLFKFSTDADSEFSTSNIYSSQILSDGSFVLGTVSNGIIILNSYGKLKYHITQSNGLSNNTVLSLFEDTDRNLWIGLDNGINCVNLKSPVKSFVDNTGILGTVYASLLHQNKLYIGTNQGLFYKTYNTNENFKFISGTKGQVWSLSEYAGNVFCNHDSGAFIIENGFATKIFSQIGTWKSEIVPNKNNLLLMGCYNGLIVLEKRNNQWVYRNKILGFDYSTKYFEILKNNEVYVSHEYKGVFRLQLDNNLLKVKKTISYSSPKKGKNSSLVKFNNIIYYAYKDGIFKLNYKTKQFQKDNTLSSVFENDEYTSGKLIIDNTSKIWLFSKDYIYYFSLNKLGTDLKKNSIPIPSKLTNSMLGYENITRLSNSIYLVGTSDGYYTLNINDLSFKNYSVSISNISINKLNEQFTNCSILEEGNFSHDENNITISYTVPQYNKYINSEYQYLLEGFQNDWSEWNAKSSVNFKNLPHGTYTFKVRAKIANSVPENIATYTFTVLKPWYLTNLAIIIYLILLLILAHYINKSYKVYYQKQEEKLIEENNLLLEIKELENDQQLMKLRNKQLANDVDTKNKELAMTNMSLINKNELLSLIKEDLKNSSSDNSSRSIKSVITSITKNISEEDSWKVFKEAFDNADKDFLKKVKDAHSNLTPNDLRLCAYLRVNLSSKEIAPLLGISVRSVEIKRYRLRKKMDLSHEKGLVEYILSI
ncbi:triple tyrosine motif-containing protein [Flavobacterium luteum]|nr:triple tyrosine motif-containing protein [Flavobacterium luteum]